MNVSDMRRIDQALEARGSILNTAVTAGGAGDATAINSNAIDRQAGDGERFSSAVVFAAVRATMASGNTVSVALKFQDSANNSDWTDYGDALAATTIVSAAGGAVVAKFGHQKLGVDLTKARRYVRAVVTPDMSATGTDTAVVSGVVVCGGAQATLPRTQTLGL